VGGVEVRKEMDIEVAVDVEIEIEVEVEIEVAIEPIRVDTKLDIVETEAELGTKSRIHNLAFCAISPRYSSYVAI
jgi:hypothetical protein